MRTISHIQVKKMKADRALGSTIPELERKYGIPRSSVWRHTHDVVLRPDILRSIQSRRGGSRSRRVERIKIAEKAAAAIVDRGFNAVMNPFILSSLYWAEGTKSSFVFTNTDAEMIKVFLKILRSSFDVTDDRLQILIRIGEKQSASAAKAFWSKVTNVDIESVHLNMDVRHNSSKSEWGLCRITVKKGAQLLKLVSAINKNISRSVLNSKNMPS